MQNGDIGSVIFFLLFSGGILAILFSCIVIVRGKTAAILETLGKPHINAMSPGFHIKFPWPITIVVGRVNLATRQIDADVDVKTKDNAFMNVPVSVQYRASDNLRGAVRAYYELDNPEQQIRSYILNNARQSVSKMDMSDLYSNRDNIEKQVQSELEEKFEYFGFHIENVLVDQPQPSKDVQQSFNRVIASIREREAAQNFAEAERIRMVGVAQAEAESKKLQGQGVADMRREMAKGMKEAMSTIKDSGVEQKDALKFIIDATRLDTLESASKYGSLIIMDTDKQNNIADTVAAIKSVKEDTNKNDKVDNS
jgi:regulator of protease activity HflC (stomatin/prohibitin superfamily)